MGVSEIVAQIDQEIAQLQQARELLAGETAPGGRRTASAVPRAGKKQRNLTPEGRKRIAEAVKRRWAEQRKAAGK